MDRTTLFNLRSGIEQLNPRTKTEKDQSRTERLVRKAYHEKLEKWGESSLRLFKLEHIRYLTKRIVDLPTSMEHLDASQPWLAYWMVNALRLLNFRISETQKCSIISLLKSCQHPDGGFAGGPKQLAHLAPTYGAVNCLASLACADALNVIDRHKLGDWLLSLRQPDGSFIMHHGGEVDVRGAYCAVSVAALTGLLKSRPEIFTGTAEWIARCQTYEGGFAGQPGLEAHGGYCFCAFAALHLLGRTDVVNVPRLLRWSTHRQLPTEGGFQGRTNKLVDSCYSFWVGALFPLLEDVLCARGDPALNFETTLFDASALQEYILLCCQKVFYMRPGLSVPSYLLETDGNDSSGGLVDKPGKNVDPYHTSYALSGLSVAQHTPRTPPAQSPLHDNDESHSLPLPYPHFTPSPAKDVAGTEWGNELADLDPSFNIVFEAVAFTTTYFAQLDAGKSVGEAAKAALAMAEPSCLVSNLETAQDPADANGFTFNEADEEYPREPPQICTSP
uniref:Protein farnesyltransferase subunit beta n=1 Tax=Schistocephalus solidus TaxID=70667 RepID=A0A0X3PET7_SCHSO